MITYTRNFNDLSIGTWIDPLTGQGYSGPKKKPTDIPADPTTGAALPTTPTVNRAVGSTQTGGGEMPPTPTPTRNQAPTIDLTQFQTEDPLRKFNLALLDMLKKAQSGQTQFGQEQAQLKREAYRSGQEVFTGEEAKMTPGAKMATLQRNVEMYEPSIQAATIKIQQLKDITDLMKTTYGEDFSKILPVTEEDAQTFKLALRAGMTIPADILTKYGKYFTTDDWASWSEANKKGTTKELTLAQEYSRADRIANQFDTEATVKRYNAVAEGYTFAKNLNTSISTAATDQGLIYAFAKAMDPDSVVREGEYATVQKYSQSWAEKFGFDVQRMYSNVPFLTKEARNNMVATIKAKYDSIYPSYKNIRKYYTDRIDDILGTGAGEDYITNYSSVYEQEIPVKNKQTGETGWIPENEFDPSIYEKLKQ